MRTKTRLLSERFEVAYNQIDEALKSMLKIYNRGFSDRVRIGASRHKIIKEFQDELLQYARLRNAIVHEKTELGYYIAEPHENVVERIEQIARLMTEPEDCLSIATRQVVYFHEDDPLITVIRKMQGNHYSQFPVYDDYGCVGLLKCRTIVKWLANHLTNGSPNMKILSEVTVGDIYGEDKNYPIVFVPKSYTIFEIEDVFEEFHKHKKDLEMAIVTENGRRTENPLGVVTPWDLIEIDYTVDS